MYTTTPPPASDCQGLFLVRRVFADACHADADYIEQQAPDGVDISGGRFA